MVGVRQIDPGAIEMLKLMSDITKSLGKSLRIMNLDDELCAKIRTDAKEIATCLASEAELIELAGMIH